MESKRGFSTVEVVFAVVIMTVGLLGLAGSTAHMVRRVKIADLMTERVAARQVAIEHVRSQPFDSVSRGSETVGVFETRWATLTVTRETKLVQVITVGPGLMSAVEAGGSGSMPVIGPNATDTLTIRVMRP